MISRLVYPFGGAVDSPLQLEDAKALLGGKGAGLAEMSRLGIPVPPGFTITTEVCTYFYSHARTFPNELKEQVAAGLEYIRKTTGFGSGGMPLLVSVRSGARASMPGMMDTILNLGLNDTTVRQLAEATGNPGFAYDCYGRFIQMYSNVVLGIDIERFEEIVDDFKERHDITSDNELSAEDRVQLVASFKEIVRAETGADFPEDVNTQLWGAIGAVFDSWMNERAIEYRRINDIPASWGTAVNIQAMVFGNMGDDCATGVAFTRHSNTGQAVINGDYLVNAQGEDVVNGRSNPWPLNEETKRATGSRNPSLETYMPDAYHELCDIGARLEDHFKDMQDIEFTIQNGKLWLLQTRNGKRAGAAAIKIAVDFVKEGRIKTEEAVRRIDPRLLESLLHPRLDPTAKRDTITFGLGASAGSASGHLAFSLDEVRQMKERFSSVILARPETNPDDIQAMHLAQGILTARGGLTCHAALVARGMGRPCVVAARAAVINIKDSTLTVGDRVFTTGDRITIDGSTGAVIAGDVPTIMADLPIEYEELMAWADEIRSLHVYANADTPEDARIALAFGAEGIGLCRTEHMFFAPGRIQAVRRMIMSQTEVERRQALDLILPLQQSDFTELLTIMNGKSVTIRLLDPPLHEFLPTTDEEFEEMASLLDTSSEDIRRRAHELSEVNPMLGHRGCRLGITYPEIYEMQVRAIAQAVVSLPGSVALPEIMIPLIAGPEELVILRSKIEAVLRDITGQIPYISIGTMIELPRAALLAGQISRHADFFSFGTNDLTQTTFGLSRDDSGKFMPEYLAQGALLADPFLHLDEEGVGELISIAAERGRAKNPYLKLGVCGEHGGDPKSIAFCHRVGLHYISCSPFRIPIARLAAAQAALN